MTTVYVYADETGDLDLSGATGASNYFGFGTATFDRAHGVELWQGLRLRCDLERRGVRLPRGLHAKNDSHATRSEAFQLIRQQAPRLDATFLYKAHAHPAVRTAGPLRLYKLAWYLHFMEVAPHISMPGDTIYVVIGSLQTNNKRDAIRKALVDVCHRVGHDRTIVPCIWDAPSSWGIQVADYCVWAVQRVLDGRPCKWFDDCIEPTLELTSFPWSRARK